jgi:hypothetical protein
MNAQIGFILKVLILSIGLSLGIKYGGPFLFIPSTNLSAVIGVFTLPLIVTSLLFWRATRNS